MTYPPDKSQCAHLLDELIELDGNDRSAFNPRKYEIIHDLAEAHFYEAQSILVRGLDHPDPDYRWACTSALAVHWQNRDSDVINRIIEMAKHDSDIQVRMIAISSLGFLRVQEAVPVLQSIGNSHTEDETAARAALEALSNFG